MTRGRRRNRIALSGPARARQNDEVVIEGSDSVMIDDLRARGLITAPQHKAARVLLRDYAARNERAVSALAQLPVQKQGHITTLILQRKPLVEHGEDVQGFKSKEKCFAWSLNALRTSLDVLAVIYAKGNAVPGYGAEDVDLEDTDE